MYLTITRPDISFVFHVVRQFVVAPTTLRWADLCRTLCYLYHTDN